MLRGCFQCMFCNATRLPLNFTIIPPVRSAAKTLIANLEFCCQESLKGINNKQTPDEFTTDLRLVPVWSASPSSAPGPPCYCPCRQSCRVSWPLPTCCPSSWGRLDCSAPPWWCWCSSRCHSHSWCVMDLDSTWRLLPSAALQSGWCRI